MNKGLDVYENRPDIFSINGYNTPPPIPTWYEQDVFMIRAWTSWGVGIWKEKWNKIDWSMEVYNSMLNKKNNWKELKKNYSSGLIQLKEMSDTGVITGDGFIVLYLIDNNMYSVYPVKSRVRNTGHDGSGEHCKVNEKYLNQQIYLGTEAAIFPLDLLPNKKLSTIFLEQYKLSVIRKWKNKIPNSLIKKIKNIIRK